MAASGRQPGATAAPMGALADSRRARALYVLHRVLGRISGGRASLQTYLFCAQPIAADALAGLRPQAGTVVRQVAADDPLTAAFPRPATVIAGRFASGADCYAATVREQFAGYIWLRRQHYDEDEVRCRYWLPHDRCVWDFDVYVVPQFRVGRTMARLWDVTMADLSRQGMQWSFSRISLYNPASVRSHERLGARQVAIGLFVTIGPAQLALFSNYPYCHLSVQSRKRPDLKLPVPAPLPNERRAGYRPP